MTTWKALASVFLASCIALSLSAQDYKSKAYNDSPNYNKSKFRQLNPELPTPNDYRAADGSPGHEYWQNEADYKIKVRIDEDTQTLYGEEDITYHNNSPNTLEYLWVQLDQNVRQKEAVAHDIDHSSWADMDEVGFWHIKRLADERHDGGYNIKAVQHKGEELHTFINNTMMRVDLPEPLEPGDEFEFFIKWNYNIQDQIRYGGRGGYEYFEENGNYLFEIAQWFPRMCKYDDVYGWQNKQFLGRGEFALPFGDYEVEITVPSDHMVMATGDLTNKKDVLTSTQLERLEKAYKSFDEPVVIVTEEEARENEKEKAKGTKTWKFKADKVRDFAFASSRKFLWDAMGVKIGDRTVLAQSLYPKEGLPLWGMYSTRVVAHTLKTYSKYTIDYPYPHCASVHGPVWGMEYPMMTFNGGRPNPEGEYPLRIKYANISVIIHEVGHNFFPMIINSDERQWTWMDEGLNTFVQFLTEREWEREYPSRRGFPSSMISYMEDDKDEQMPIMTNSESILQFGNNAYGKPATALNILRETVMGREAFDFAFKKYAERWAFKHPEPADLFRTLEDASAVDLDWFWRGWFYTTDHVDMAITDVIHYEVSNDPDKRADFRRKQFEPQLKHPTHTLNKEAIKQTYTEKHPETKDKYTNPDLFEVDEDERKRYEKFKEDLEPEQKELLERVDYVYEIQIENKGGLVMPVILRLMYEDGSEEVMRIPAEIWRHDNHKTTKLLNLEKPLEAVELDPYRETADIDPSNNTYPPHFDERFLKISR